MENSISEAALDGLRRLWITQNNWARYGDGEIDVEIFHAAEKLLLSMADCVVSKAKIVPMLNGRLQFEWDMGDRSLELEFKTPETLCYLKWDSGANIDEEGTIPVADTAAICQLIVWVLGGSENA